MEGLSFFVGVIGNIISVTVVLSPIKTFLRIVKHRSTEDFESFPYVIALLGTSLWCYYGVIKPGGFILATTNGLGIIIELVYVTLFIIYAPLRVRAKTAIYLGILNVAVPAIVILITLFTMHGDLRIDVLGFVCAGLSIVMYGSPLVVVKRVLTTKSVEYMPLLLSFFFFLNGGIWTFYAILVKDFFLGVPNGIGFLLGTAQMVLYAIYWKSKSSQNISEELEDGWQHKHLIPENSSED
ncbi:Bidirectional sugar transporter SWEET17 [Vitis vinifera]|uniref:Bidirectional sugar transporter SWEET n=1 Tax=Vitis vinifera TaxID=29760 RepID=A0A438FLJ7_VITVI|nr:Bidirectional sugar transporter SWEET17 [Vitis vinifera]